MRATLTPRLVKSKTSAPQHKSHPTLPIVNLLSPWSFDQLANRKLRQRFIAAGCALALLVGAGWAVQELRANQAQQLLNIEKAEGSRLAAQTTSLAPVRIFVASVDQQKKSVSDTMSREVQFSRVLDGLAIATPADAQMESIAVTLPDPPAVAAKPEGETTAPAPAAAPVASPCPGPDPFNTRTVIGCVTLSGTAATRASVGEFVISLGHSKLFVEPFISTTTTADGEQVTFTGSVGLSEKAFSKRYADLGGLLKAQLKNGADR